MNFQGSPRQPLVGVALAGLGGILLAEFLSVPITPVCVFIAAAAVVSLIRPATWLTHLLVAATFCTLHLIQQTDAPGRELSALRRCPAGLGDWDCDQ
jgi:hypothetical protein